MKIQFSSNLLPLSLGIQLWCLSRSSHAEFIFSDGTSIYPAVESGRVILTRGNSYLFSWSYELDITPEQEKVLRDWAESQIGVKYDYTALAPFNVLIPRTKKRWKDPVRWMCSEFCAYGLELVGVSLFEEDFRKVKPSDLHRRIRNHPVVRRVQTLDTALVGI